VERAKVDKLLADAEAWRKSALLRKYISRAREFVIARDGAIERGGELERWLKWAADQADRLDPFCLARHRYWTNESDLARYFVG
jgi:hypothetical protein